MLTLAIEHTNPSQPPHTAAADQTDARRSSAAPAPAAVAIGRLTPGRFAGSPDILATATLQPRSRRDDGLAPAIDRAARDAGILPADLKRVAVSVGPGGFTATRLGVTTAKTIAHILDLPLAPITTAHAAALAFAQPHLLGRAAEQPSRHPAAAGRTIVALAWKRDTVWRERFVAAPAHHEAHADRADRPPLAHDDVPAPAGLVTLAELAAELRTLADAADDAHPVTLIADDRFIAHLTAAVADDPRAHPDIIIAPPVFDARAVHALAAVAPTQPHARVLPLYPREPEAVSKWRRLQPTTPPAA